jgi:hypothetical protein
MNIKMNVFGEFLVNYTKATKEEVRNDKQLFNEYLLVGGVL